MIPNARTARSMTAWRVVAGGPPNRPLSVSGCACPTVVSPVLDIIDVSDRILVGCSIAIV